MSDCIEWTKSFRSDGYGQLRRGGKNHGAHRWTFAMANPGVNMDGLDVMHSCDNRKCVNIDHLSLGTRKENLQDMIQKGRRVYGTAKLSPDDLPQMRSMRDAGMFYGEIGERLGVSRTSVSNMLNGRSFQCQHYRGLSNGEGT